MLGDQFLIQWICYSLVLHICNILILNLGECQISTPLNLITLIFFSWINILHLLPWMFYNIIIFVVIIVALMFFVQSIMNVLFSVLTIFNYKFFTNSMKLCDSIFEHFSIIFFGFYFCKTIYQLLKAFNFFYQTLRLFVTENVSNDTIF